MTDLITNSTAVLKKGEGRTIKAGGAWIYDNEIDTITGTFKNGDKDGHAQRRSELLPRDIR